MSIYLILALSYIAGLIVAAGVRGGVRDEMEGIGDMFVIVFWPIWLVISILKYPVCALYNLGKYFKR